MKAVKLDIHFANFNYNPIYSKKLTYIREHCLFIRKVPNKRDVISYTNACSNTDIGI